MPLRVSTTTGTSTYGNPIVGQPGPLLQVVVDISELTTAEVDADGNLKPGVMFEADGGQPDGTGPVYAMNLEPISIGHATIPPTDVSLAADTGTVPIGMTVGGIVNRDIVEDNLGRAMTANELAGLVAAGSQFTLTNT